MENLLKGNVVPYGIACSQIPQDGLIASYLLQGTAESETGSFNGTETSSVYAYDDERGIVGSFNGTSNYTTLANGIIAVSDVFTATVWFKTVATAAGGVFTYTNGADLSLSVNADGTVTAYTYANGVGLITTTGAYNDGEWHFAKYSYDRTTVVLDIDNGVEIVSTTSASGDMRNLARQNLLGALTNGTPTSYFNGSISNLHFYNRILTSTEITDIYNLEKYKHNNALDQGLIAYYPLDGNSLDNAINQYDGTDTSVSYVADPTFGIVAELNGTNSYIQIPYNHTTGELSFSVDINMDSLATIRTILSKVDDTTSVNNFTLSVDTDGTIYLANEYSAGLYYTIEPTNVLSINTWYKITVTFATTGAKLYLNGVLIGSDSNNHIASTTALMNNINFRLGTNIFANGNWFDGKMSKARLYNRALSDKEIEWLYDYEKPNSTLCLYNSTIDNPDPFEDGSGIALYKLDGNANDTTGVYDGTPTSITYTSGEFGQSAVFTASTSYINTGFKPSLTNFSVSFRVKPNNITTLYGYCGTQTNTGTDRLGFVLYQNSTGYISANTSSSTGGNSIVSNIQASSTEFRHVVYTYSNGEYKLYVDGVLKGTNTSIITSHYGNIHIGSYYASVPTASSLGGQEDQFRYFNKTLTQEEVTKLYNERKV